MAHSSKDQATIVIVGAGSIGLWTAYFLAQAQAGPQHASKITVIDACHSPFAATSRTCTGCIHYAFEADGLVELGRYSFELWDALSHDDAFRSAVSWRSSSIFGVERGDGENLDLLPEWLRRREGWRVNREFLGARNAMVYVRFLVCYIMRFEHMANSHR